MTNKLVSIVIPVFNKEDYISACIDSVIDQTYKNTEIILIDDGSSDKSNEICKQYVEKFDNIRLITQKNSGVSISRNKGIMHSTGAFISFIDADDYIKSNFIELMIEEIEKDNSDLVICNYLQDYDGKLLKKNKRISEGVYENTELYPLLIDDGTITGMLFSSVCTALYRTSIIKRNNILFKPQLTHNEDGIFNLDYILKTKKLTYLGNHYLYVNRRNDESATKSIVDDLRYEDATEEIVKIFDKSDEKVDIYSQLQCRNVSVAFWKIISYSNNNNSELSGKKRIKKIKDILKDDVLKMSFSYLEYNRISKPKLFLSNLMKLRQASLIYIFISFFYPKLSSIYQR